MPLSSQCPILKDGSLISKTINNKSGNEETKKEIDALGRMMINLEDIKEFYTWSQKQAKASFILAVSMYLFFRIFFYT